MKNTYLCKTEREAMIVADNLRGQGHYVSIMEQRNGKWKVAITKPF
jgi:hypothetical protein